MTFWIADWLRAFALTLLVEIPIATPLLKLAERSAARRIAIVVVANLAIHPLVWFDLREQGPRLGQREAGDAVGRESCALISGVILDE